MEAAWFSPEQGRLLWQDYLTRQQHAPKIRYNFPDRKPLDEVSPHRVKVKNTGTEVIPAFACMRIIGVEDIAGNTCIRVEKPTTTDGQFLFNGPYEIAVPADATDIKPAQLGVGWAYRHGVGTMLGDEPTEPGATFGPIVDSWEIEEGGDQFVVFGRHDFSDRALVGRFNGGGSTTHEIFFQIESVICDEFGAKTLYVTALWYDGGCTKNIPGEDDYGQIEVIDPCNELAFYAEQWLSSGSVTGWAKRMHPRGAEYCEPQWLVRSICGVPECS